ncbi:MAG: hypothetical protein ACFFB5_09010 [Promethearchaeota archaeon]
MTENILKNDHKVKICVLSHSKELINHFIRKLLSIHKEEATFRNFAALGISIATINLSTNNNRFKLILLITTGQEFLDKLRLYYQGASGAIILFNSTNSDSFEAAKRHFQYFRKITLNPLVPIIFIDILEKYKEIIIEEPERLEEESNILYYEINEDNFPAFNNILESIIRNHWATLVPS